MQNRISSRGGSWDTSRGQPADTSFFAQRNNFKAAMLLPTTGSAAAYGTGLKNAALMAIEDANNPNLVIQFYDTQSTSQGADAAARNAIRDGADLILGPLTREEVSAIIPLAKSADVPVISYTASPAVLNPGIYTLGLLGNEQIDRIIGYAAEKGRRRIVLMVPDNESGMNMAEAAVNSASRHNVEIVKIGFYPPETLDFSSIVKSLTDYDVRSQKMAQHKQTLTQRAKSGDKKAENDLKKLKTTYTEGDVDFDAVLIPETGSRLKSAAAMFGYYDVSYPNVLFMGTSVWENTSLNKETTLYHGVFPVISRVHNNYFNKKYQDYFGTKPNQLYSFAYDSVLLASALTGKNPKDLETAITEKDGYIGINGVFRIFPDGSNQHSLDIIEVTANGNRTIDTASKQFMPLNTAQSVSVVQMPVIYGKDPSLVERRLQKQPRDYFDGFIFRSRW